VLAETLLIVSGLILIGSTANVIPAVGPTIAKAGSWLARFGIAFGIADIVVALIKLF
jgi:uncharacterized membrane protein SirB2